MKAPGLLCVLAVACASAEALSSEEERIVRSATTSAEPRIFYIYPRSGRLFHADYVRDNEIFKSLERTNFMRRGPFANGIEFRRTNRDIEKESVVKKHTYVDAGRIPAGKKSVLGKVREHPSNVVNKFSSTLLRGSEGYEGRIKRELRDSERTDENRPPVEKDLEVKSTLSEQNSVKDLESEKPKETYAGVSNSSTNEEAFTKEEENKVEGDRNTHTKNNDTDKTLFVLDSVQKIRQSEEKFQIPEVGVLQEEVMRKLVLDDGMNLYPVYTGVKYTYPRTERSLQYAPEMTVQMDNPEVTDYISNSTSDYEVEGRGRRRRIKKLAFPLLLALKLKAAVMLPLILGVISLVAFKGLWSGLTALGVAAALGLKALVGSGAPRVVVQAPPPPPPHYHHIPPHEYAEYWSRRDDFTDYRPSSWP